MIQRNVHKCTSKAFFAYYLLKLRSFLKDVALLEDYFKEVNRSASILKNFESYWIYEQNLYFPVFISTKCVAFHLLYRRVTKKNLVIYNYYRYSNFHCNNLDSESGEIVRYNYLIKWIISRRPVERLMKTVQK